MPDIKPVIAGSFIRSRLLDMEGNVTVLARFTGYIYLAVAHTGDPVIVVITLNGGRVGPLSIVLPGHRTLPLNRSAQGRLQDGVIEIDTLRINLHQARIHESELKARMAPARVPSWLDGVLCDLAILPRRTAILPSASAPASPSPEARALTRLFHAGLVSGNARDIATAAGRLAGLGRGLTPGGDDFLCGLMVAVWFSAPDPMQTCMPILTAVHGQTTSLSFAFLDAAAHGHVSDTWRDFLAPVSRGALRTEALKNVMAPGFSSGEDTLAGFIWGMQAMHMPPAALSPIPLDTLSAMGGTPD
ncbi:DUF2877 domain-containing protein [Komagataeibacter oboediens]|uniref:oxamate carbamoyltransferase subunit AllH family protein n=1 Tax=Komagataeibacter oboediens TaxID=65958 RepID=UPI0023DCD205|nr:DUF2877 domain-containing protein [Komagataeibacter oboediens]WEQ51115.1 DUF2877 domain-containing protein [Komagataeibacter oboediens]